MRLPFMTPSDLEEPVIRNLRSFICGVDQTLLATELGIRQEADDAFSSVIN